MRPPVGPAGLAALVLLQVAVTAAPLALLPVLGLQIARMDVDRIGASPAFWTAAVLAAPAVTTLAMTPAWPALARRLSLSALVVWTGLLSAASCGLIALAADPVLLLAGRLVQGLAGGGVVLALAFRAAGRSAGRDFSLMQQAVSAGCLIGPLAGGLAFERGWIGGLMLACAGLILALALAAAHAARALASEPEAAAGPATAGPEKAGSSAGARTLAPLLAGTCGSAGAFAFVAFFPTWASAHDAALYTPGLIGLLHSLSWVAALLVLPLWARGLDGVRPVLALGLSLVGCGLGYALVPLGLGLAGIVALRLVQGAVYAGQAPALFAAAEGAGRSRAAALARARAGLTVGQLLGPVAAGLALAPLGPSGPLFVAAGLSLAGALALAPSLLPRVQTASLAPDPVRTRSRAP
ncbi:MULTISPECIES: MFS transporter [Methylobacterium]|uniref:MFS transporter n=1 Tax=Methylobacterium TaxID=407 RepID=UPI0013EB891C|nr:MFS transporter [Methylobacterium sp. DB0501]NGM34134.1 MFS transporter [Methylobacterium sp. DB0501]